MNRYTMLVLAVALSLSVAGCKKEEHQPPVEPQAEPALTENGNTLMPSSGESPNTPNSLPPVAGGDQANAAVANAANTANAGNAGSQKPQPVKVDTAQAPPDTGPKPGDIPAPADVAEVPADAEKTASGLASKVLAKGTGAEKPSVNDTVKVHYTGWTTDGQMFDSSVKRGEPAEFPLGRVIPGWTEGVQLMVVGEKRRFWIPEELAYKGKPNGPQGMLVFDVELLEVKTAPRAPEDVAAVPADAEKTESGLASRVLTAGTGAEKPGALDTVKVHYSGWTTDGKLFDSSVQRGEPVSFPLNRVVPGWSEGVQLMVVGEKRRLWIPEELAYKGAPGAPEGMLVFDVELLEVNKAPESPADVAEPPADAEKTESGLASKVLTKGTGANKPAATATVEVHYTGWTTDGEMFDSSVSRGKPAKFALNAVIPGWTEALQLMVEGEKRRIWIPEELAYKGQPGRPAGMLVFDVELLKIH